MYSLFTKSELVHSGPFWQARYSTVSVNTGKFYIFVIVVSSYDLIRGNLTFFVICFEMCPPFFMSICAVTWSITTL